MLPPTLVKEAQTCLDWFQTEDTEQPKIDLIKSLDSVFLMGHHSLGSAIELARLLRQRDPLPIAISGGLGRGTFFARNAVSKYLANHGKPIPKDFQSLSEARLFKLVLENEGCPIAGSYLLEEHAKHSEENVTRTHEKFSRQLKLDDPDADLGLVQCPTQRFRAKATAMSIFRCRIHLLNLAPVDLLRLSIEDSIIEIFRLVGLKSEGFDGESEILQKFLSDSYERVPDNIKEKMVYIRNEFSEFIDQNEKFRLLIEPVVKDDPAADNN